jgi:hypothetical protein
MRNNKQVELFDNWFKVKMMSRVIKNDSQQVEYAYIDAKDADAAKARAIASAGPGWIAKIKPISYRQMIKEISCERSY